MASASKRFIVFIVYWFAPGLALLLIMFGGEFQLAGFFAFGVLFLFHLVRGKDYQGNPTTFGIRRDSSWLGEQRQVSDGGSILGKKRRVGEQPEDE